MFVMRGTFMHMHIILPISWVFSGEPHVYSSYQRTCECARAEWFLVSQLWHLLLFTSALAAWPRPKTSAAYGHCLNGFRCWCFLAVALSGCGGNTAMTSIATRVIRFQCISSETTHRQMSVMKRSILVRSETSMVWKPKLIIYVGKLCFQIRKYLLVLGKRRLFW